MRHLILTLATLHTISCGNLVAVQPAYHPVFEYDVPVPHQPALYSAPSVHASAHAAAPVIHHTQHSHITAGNPYVGTYAVHTTPAISHSYQHTQTHPVPYIRPVTVTGHYYAPTAASTIEQSRLIVPATSRVYKYQNYGTHPQHANYNQQAYAASYNSYPGNDNDGVQNNGVYRNTNANVGNDQVKIRRYQIRRPAIHKEFYDIEEKVVVRPAGSALIELDPPISKTLKSENVILNRASYGQSSGGQNNGQYNGAQNYGQNYNQNGNQRHGQIYGQTNNQNYNQNENVRYYHGATATDTNSYRVNDCDFYTPTQTPASVPTTVHNQFHSTNPYTTPAQYHPTTFDPTTSNQLYPTTPSYSTTSPSRTYQPPFQDQSSSTNTHDQYHPTTFSPPAQYTPTYSSSSTEPTVTTTTPKQTDIYVSSTTPVSVTIIDKNDDGDSTNKNRSNNTQAQAQDIIYATEGNNGQPQYIADENGPDQFQNELPPRGDVAQYRADQPDQFYHELPRSRYTNDPYRPPEAAVNNVYTKSNGEPTERNYYSAEAVEIQPKSSQNSTGNSTSAHGNDQQQRLIALYTGNGGVSEVGQTEQTNSRYTDDNRAPYQNVGNVRARIVSVTPPPDDAVPSQHVNTRRIVVSKHITTVQEVDEADNATTVNENYKAANGQYNAGHQSDGYNTANNNVAGHSEQYNNNENNFDNNENDQNSNGNEYDANGNYRPGGRANYNANYNDATNKKYNEANNINNNSYNRNFNGESAHSNSNANTASSSTSSGYYISTTPSSASQRIIYVQPVAQDFAEKKATAPSRQQAA